MDGKYGRRFYITSRDGSRAEIYPMEVWERIEADLANMPASDAKSRFEDAVNYYGQVVELDSQDRLLIPQILRTKADLKGDVAVLGKGERMEIVNDSRFVSSLESEPFRGSDLAVVGVKGI
jgi:MraZ protein